ncbi:stromal membrane-associated protein 1 isoform X2 [Bacillus rossius redtenbacheri]|uniref:stromal membrane-associated protein 1 isoform X2 n=1 Tax=Bacillus rossius redtenbacheri TaxID=93214 RepID=UPI002FDE5548
MSSKAEKDKQKQIQDRCQTLLNDMLRDDDNKYCVDCDAKGPRWASWNLGIFLCIRCAGIHRNLGVHISKVKSVNLDTWTPEQVVSLQQMGNSRARAVYEANLPDNFRRPQTDSSLEAFVRAKYEQKKYIAREWVPPPVPKVNWDRELEEEAERQRRRKKEAKQQLRGGAAAALPEATVPQLLPKPKSTGSPKPPREARPAPASATQDLLGLDAPECVPAGGAATSPGDDIFSGFLSAPPVPASADPVSPARGEEPGKGRSAEEESFFNQPAPSAQERRQLTKDSILALYSTSLAPAPPVAQPVFGIPGGMYAAPKGAFPQPAQAPIGFPVPNGMMAAQPMPSGVQNGVFGGSNLIGQQPAAVASNPFFSMAAPAVAQLPQQFARLGLATPQQGMVGAAAPLMGVPLPTQPVMSSFQQGAAPSPAHTLATNLWQ